MGSFVVMGNSSGGSGTYRHGTGNGQRRTVGRDGGQECDYRQWQVLEFVWVDIGVVLGGGHWRVNHPSSGTLPKNQRHLVISWRSE